VCAGHQRPFRNSDPTPFSLWGTMTGAGIAIERLRHEPNAQAVRRVRCSIIGRQHFAKAECIQQGLLSALSAVLADSSEPHTVTEAAYLISALAREGPTFVEPILKSDVLVSLLQFLPERAHSRQQLAILRCVNSIADNLPSKEPGQWPEDTSLAELLYTKPHAAALLEGIRSATSSLISQQICDLIIGLLCKTCRSETQKRLMADLGISQVLANRLASFVVAEGLVVPSPEALDFPSSAGFGLAAPAPATAHLSPTLEAIAVFIEGSKERAQSFLSDAILNSVLPQSRDEFFPSDARSLHGNATVPRSRHRELDSLLPLVPVKERNGSVSNINFPPLGSGRPLQRRRSSFQPAQPQSANINFATQLQHDKDEKALIPYLLLVAREARGRRRLLACKVLVNLHALMLVPTSRSRTFGALLVPLLVRMLDQGQDSANSGSYMADGIHYTRAAPHVLGMLIMDDSDLQKAAVDAGAIAKLATGLKASFDVPSDRKKTPWRPTKEVSMVSADLAKDCMLGQDGPSLNMRQDMAYREGLLQALAAIAPFNDDYRKQICDQGILAQIMQAMEPFHATDSTIMQEASGNSASTILAACGTIRALTRSVTALRTKLVDAEVAKAVIRLMSNPDPEVRIAATKVLANLAMDFSPMKESVADAAVVKKLCEQAHSANARLRLESLWALKQLVVNASRSQKIDVVNELGSSWIRLLVRTDPYDIPEGEVIGLIVDKEYPVVEASDDVVMSEDSEGEGPDFFQDAGAPIPAQNDDFNQHTPEDDLAIQEQVLDLLRNLFCGDTASDLVDYVLGQMGKAEFFDILRKRLAGKKLYGATRRETVESPAPVGVVVKVLYIVVHIAACSQRWRRALINETSLLKLILGFCGHQEREIRAQICWLAINILYEDQSSDKGMCRLAAIELVKLGYRDRLARLENDSDLDVRERAKTAGYLFSSLLDSRDTR
jgi:armadillo repeat-containing protein 8